jgi:hypothetical protein
MALGKAEGKISPELWTTCGKGPSPSGKGLSNSKHYLN